MLQITDCLALGTVLVPPNASGLSSCLVNGTSAENLKFLAKWSVNLAKSVTSTFCKRPKKVEKD